MLHLREARTAAGLAARRGWLAGPDMLLRVAECGSERMERGGMGAADTGPAKTVSADVLAQQSAGGESLPLDPPAGSPAPASPDAPPAVPVSDFSVPEAPGEAAGIEPPPDLEQICGSIKWFDATKGYGFIVPDDGGADVLVHVTCLRRDGFAGAAEGARIVCEAVRRAKGRQAFRVLSLDLSTAVHPVPTLPRTRAPLVPGEAFERATVKWFNRLRGFGFLSTGEGAPDIFVHMEILRRNGLTELKPGQTVLVRYGDSSKGRMAAEVKADPSSGGTF